MEAELSSEVGPAGQLFKGNVDLFWALLQRVTILKFEDSQKKALRDEFGKLYFWGDGYYPYEGRLDTIMEYSSRLRSRVLSVLTEIGDILCNEKSGLFGLVNGKFGDEKLDQQRLDVRNLVEMIQASLNDSDADESDSGSFSSDGSNGIDDIIWELRIRNQCLMDLRASLERPAPEAGTNETEAPAAERFQVSGPAEIWTRKILDTNPTLDLTLAGRLGESNWQRYQRVSERMEAMEDMDSEDDEEDDDHLGDLPLFPEGTISTRDQSSIFSASGAGGSSQGPTTATSISQTRLEYAFPRARRRKVVPKDTRSQATYTSRVTDDRGERGWLRIPKLPIEDKDLGDPFRCTVCGEKQQDITSRADWKKHVFADIQPYICTFSDCKDSLKTYPTRKLWADHEFTIHRFEKVWNCTYCSETLFTEAAMKDHLKEEHKYSHLTDHQLGVMIKARESMTTTIPEDSKCPFCSDSPGKTSRAFAMHVARHMEEIALAVLPREDADSDYEGGSISSSSSVFDLFGPVVEIEVEKTDQLDKTSDELRRQSKPLLTDIPAQTNHNELLDSTGKPGFGLNDFNFLATIGKGNFGKVLLAETKALPKKIYAIKIYKKDFIIENDEVSGTRVERNVFRLATKTQHPFLVQLIGSFQTETRLYYVTEYMAGGDLMLHIQRGQFSMTRTKLYAAEVLLALKCLHENGIIYRDIKLDNVLVGLDGHVKLTDFNLCKEDMWYGSTTKTFLGTPEFMAPELLLDKQYGRAVDWWAFGVLIYQMLLQQSPFRGEDEDEIYDTIIADEPLYPIHMPRDSVNILQRLLERDPDKRLGSGPTDAQEIQGHGFFKDLNWDDVYHKRYTPAFVPEVTNEVDVSNFDAEFTTATPVLTPVQSVLSAAMQEEFRGFSWAGADA